MTALYIVPTPIGNLEDITIRGLRILKDVSLIAAEDTRTTRKLLTSYKIKTPVVSFNQHNHNLRIPKLLKHLEHGDIALVSEAGTPGISDPGDALIRATAKTSIRIVSLPGASAVTTALAASGLPANSFLFLGFPPRRQNQRLAFFKAIAHETRTLVILESPHRLQRTLKDVETAIGDRDIAVCRELTKLYEEVLRAKVSDAIRHFEKPRGEFTLVVAGAAPSRDLPDKETLRLALCRLTETGSTPKDAIDQLSRAFGTPKRQVYKLWLEMK